MMIKKFPIGDFPHINEFSSQYIYKFIGIHNIESVGQKNKKNTNKKKYGPVWFTDERLDIIKYMAHKLAVITVIYENYTILTDYFASFDKQTDLDLHIYVVDNSIKMQKPEYPSYVTYIQSSNNGYAAGVNTGLTQAQKDGYDLFCVTNSDIMVKNDFIAQLKKSMIDHPASLIGGKIYYAKGFEYHKNKYKNNELDNVIWYAGGINDWNNCQTKHRGVDEVDKGQYDNFEKTDFITGCLMCFDQTVIEKVGTWDESYFLYYEDADFCERAKKNGIDLYYDPSIVIWHKNAASTGGSGSNTHIKHQQKNQLTFGLKYAPLRTKLHLLKNYFFAFLKSFCNCSSK